MLRNSAHVVRAGAPPDYRPHDPRLGAPGDVPKRTGDAAPSWPVAVVSTVAPASTLAPVAMVAMAPVPVATPITSILLPQNPCDGRGWSGINDARTQPKGGEAQCAGHRSPGRNLLQIHCIHCKLPSHLPYESATLANLKLCRRSAIWCNPRRHGGR